MDIIKAAQDAFRGAALGDQQRQIIDLLMQEIGALNRKVARLEQELTQSRAGGLPSCPFCGARAWALTATRRHMDYDLNGLQFHAFRCGSCGKAKEHLAAE